MLNSNPELKTLNAENETLNLSVCSRRKSKILKHPPDPLQRGNRTVNNNLELMIMPIPKFPHPTCLAVGEMNMKL